MKSAALSQRFATTGFPVFRKREEKAQRGPSSKQIKSPGLQGSRESGPGERKKKGESGENCGEGETETKMQGKKKKNCDRAKAE